MKHKHHIIPRYQGGSDDLSNIVELTVTQHAMWHFAEWQRKGNWQDNLAFQVLVGRLNKEEAIRIANSAVITEYNKSRRGSKRPVWVKEKIRQGLKKFYGSLDKPCAPPPIGGRGIRGRKPKPVELTSSCESFALVFESAVKAAECLNLNPSAITKCARGVWSNTGGWKVRYI